MRYFVAKIIFSALFVLAVFSAFAAGKVTFEANTPMTVALDGTFRVEFALNASPDEGSFRAPSFEGFDVIAGPVESKGSSIEIINGSMTKSVSYTITYVLMPQAAGTVSLGVAEVAVDGATYRTSAQPIEVVDESGGGQSSAPDRPQRQENQQGDVQSRISRDDILLRAVASRTSVYKGEPLHVVYKLYSRLPIVNYGFDSAPSFNGFWAQDITDTNTIQSRRETYNGKVYEAYVLKETLLYPQQSGTLTIDPAELTAVAQVVVQSRRNADPFFGGGHEVYNVPRKVQSQKITIQVKGLPAGAPATFSGAVGNFTMEASTPPERLTANSAATYTVKISGTGNLTFVQAPRLPLPTSFEQYNVKTTESINASAAGISGYRQFEYPFIARAEGSYEVEPVEFSYFHPERMHYVTLRSKPLTLEVAPDASGGASAPVVQGRGMSKEEVKMLGQDIRFIKLGGAQLRSMREPLLFSATYWTLLAGILAIFTMIYIALRRQIRDSHNVALMRGKRANKIAVQRFRAARKYMEEQNRHAFYEEMLRAMWGYMSDRFNIPVANLTKENVREELHKRGVAAEDSQRFAEIITRCDEAQYSPAASAQMSDVYSQGVDFISRIESVIKR